MAHRWISGGAFRAGLSGLLALAGIGYPLLVYAGTGRLSPGLLIAIALVLVALRLGLLRASLAAGRPGRDLSPAGAALLPLVIGGACFGLIALLEPGHAPFLYPVIMSLTAAAAFGVSLLRPPSLVERIARITEPQLPAAGVAYTRRVTQVWTLFLAANAVASASLGIWGSIGLWTLWTGGISYLLIGALLAGEFLLRGILRRRGAFR